MKTYTEILDELNESTEEPLTHEELKELVVNLWEKEFPKSLMVASKPALTSDDATDAIFKGYLMSGKKEWINGISNNDPLSLVFMIRYSSSVGYVIEFSLNSISISPENKYMAYGSHKIKTRKGKAKNVKALEKKMKDLFKKVKDDVKMLLDEGKFDVYKEDIQKLIVDKVK